MLHHWEVDRPPQPARRVSAQKFHKNRITAYAHRYSPVHEMRAARALLRNTAQKQANRTRLSAASRSWTGNRPTPLGAAGLL